MARRRYIGTGISTDERIAELSDAAALLWTWMIPHAEDSATITGSVKELKWTVIPSRDWTLEKLESCLNELSALGLIVRRDGTIYLDSDSFYCYQTYIPEHKRSDHSALFLQQRKTPKNSEERRESAKNAASPSPSPSPSPSLSPSKSANALSARVSTRQDRFSAYWASYPKKDSKAKCEAAWRKLDDDAQDRAIRSVPHLNAWIAATGTELRFVPGATVWLNQRRFDLWCDGPPDGYAPAQYRERNGRGLTGDDLMALADAFENQTPALLEAS